MYSIQDVIKFVNNLWQVGGFHWVLQFPPPKKLIATITETLLKVALNTVNPLYFSFLFLFNFQPKFEAVAFEIDYCRNDLIDTMNNLKEWMKPEKVRLCYSLIGGG